MLGFTGFLLGDLIQFTINKETILVTVNPYYGNLHKMS